MRRISSSVGCGFIPNAVEDLFAMDGHRAWCINSDPHLVAFDTQDRDRYRLTNVDRFSDAPCQNQHPRVSESMPKIDLAEHITVYNSTPNPRPELINRRHGTPFNGELMQRRGVIPYTAEC
jgi:hypothetical protein